MIDKQENLSDEKKNRILLGVSAGIALYKSVDLARLLTKNHFLVEVILTPTAAKMIHPLVFQAVTHQPVWCHETDNQTPHGMSHIQLSHHFDLILIAPATANIIAKLAHGIADNLLLSTALARTKPLMVAPSMNCHMWSNPATQRNMDTIQKDGIHILWPETGEQACGEYGIGRLQDVESIFHHLTHHFLCPPLLQKKKILITAGPTREPIDAVRYITNNSSGKMGISLVWAAQQMGAEVTLILGPSIPAPYGVRCISVTTTQEMHQAVQDNAAKNDIFISVAAVCDYTPCSFSDEKLRKKEKTCISFSQTIDILSTVAENNPDLFCVGFCCETSHLDERAEKKRQDKKVPLIIGNLAQDALNQETNQITLYDRNGRHPLPKEDKKTLSTRIMKHIYELMTDKPKH